MNAGTVSSGTTIGRLTVRWRVDADLRDADRGRLDGLVRELCDGPLEDALTDPPGGHSAEVCIRRVVVPPHRVRWDCADAELVSGWARAIGHAVHGTMIPADDVVRFASRSHAQADLIVSVLAGHRERLWAWRLLGLWPAGTWTDAEAVSSTAAAAADERPGALVALVVAAARAGQLGRFVEYVGPDALAGLARRLWLAAGGTLPPSPRAAVQDVGAVRDGAAAAALAGRLAALLRQRSEIIAYALRLSAARLAASVRLDAPGPAAPPGIATVLPSPAAPGPPAESATGSVAGSVAESLAVLAVLETEPAMAVHPDAWSAVAMTARALRATGGEPQSLSAAPDAGSRPDRPPDPVSAEAGWSATQPRSPLHEPPAPPPETEPDGARIQPRQVVDDGVALVPPGVTSWGGLLFLLPIVAELGVPASVAAEPDAYGVGLRPVLHELSRQLLLRAASAAEAPAADDPARLAFCGLSPRSDAPRSPRPRARDLIGLAAGSVVAALRERLPELASDRGDPALLLSVCRRHAVIHADPGWIDVDLRLDEVSVDVRRAGLDLDPGYLPWLGCVVRFRYV